MASVPVQLPADGEGLGGVLTTGMGAASVLMHPGLLVGRQIEMMNVLIGYEQANKYAIKDYLGNNVGFIAEEDTTFTGTMLRQLMRTRRAIKAVILDREGNEVLKIHRPVKWLLNSSIKVMTPDDVVIGEVKQSWHPLRRKYDLFVGTTQFAAIDAVLLAWDFTVVDEASQLLAAVNRSFQGFARE
ncbi:hypothetical protein HDU67_007867, partial [Dinochytrium kinnereticum]